MIDTSQEIVKIKVRKAQVEFFPFDVVYLVHRKHKDLMPRMFPYSLCLPLNEALLDKLRMLNVDAWSSISSSGLKAEQLPGGRNRPLERQLDMTSVANSFLLIPVLPHVAPKTRDQQRKDRSPAYLLAKQHRRGEHKTRRGKKYDNPGLRDEDLQAFFNDFSVMFTPRGPLRPICKACPCHLEHIQGKCSLGEQKCYESLIISPERRRNGEQLQTDGADNDTNPANATE